MLKKQEKLMHSKIEDKTPEGYDQLLDLLRDMEAYFWNENTLRSLRRLIEEVEIEKQATIDTIEERRKYP